MIEKKLDMVSLNGALSSHRWYIAGKGQIKGDRKFIVNGIGVTFIFWFRLNKVDVFWGNIDGRLQVERR